MKNKKQFFLALLIILLVPAAPLFAGPDDISIDLFAVDGDEPISGVTALTICLSSSATTQTCLVEEEQTCNFEEGVCHTTVDISTLSLNGTDDLSLWLTIDGDDLDPVALSAVPWAQYCSVAGTITDGAIGAAGLATSSVTTVKISDGTIATADLADSVITTAKISDATIVAADIAADAVEAAEIAAGAVGTSEISDGSIAAADLASSAVTAVKVADDVLDFDKLEDTLDLDASTTINADGTEVLTITNAGTGVSLLVNDVASDTTPFTIDASGKVGIGDSSPDANMEISTAADTTVNTNVFFSDGDVSHTMALAMAGLTGTATGDSFGAFFPKSSTDGGMVVMGLSDAVGTPGLELKGAIAVTDPTDTVPAVAIWGFKADADPDVDGDADPAALGAAETVLQVQNLNTVLMTVLGNGDTGIGNATPPSRFIVSPPALETIASAATITANACGTIKPIHSTGSVTTNTTDTFTAGTASYNGCCMTVVNVDNTDTITLDANAEFQTSAGANLALSPADSVQVCYSNDLLTWFQASTLIANQ